MKVTGGFRLHQLLIISTVSLRLRVLTTSITTRRSTLLSANCTRIKSGCVRIRSFTHPPHPKDERPQGTHGGTTPKKWHLLLTDACNTPHVSVPCMLHVCACYILRAWRLFLLRGEGSAWVSHPGEQISINKQTELASRPGRQS